MKRILFATSLSITLFAIVFNHLKLGIYSTALNALIGLGDFK